MVAGLVALSLALSAAGGCARHAVPRVQAGLPEPPTVVKVAMDEYSFAYRRSIAPGRVVFEVTNVGRRPHRISLLPLSEDVPPIQEQIRGSERRSVNPFAGLPPQAPGEVATLAVDLAAGVRYAMICFINEPEVSHAQAGMVSEFRTTGLRAPR